MPCWRLLLLLCLGLVLLSARSGAREAAAEEESSEAAEAREAWVEEVDEPVPTTPSYEYLRHRSASPDCDSGEAGGQAELNDEEPPRLLLLLAQLNGELLALDGGDGGRVAWRLQTADENAPLFSSTLEDIEIVDGADVFKLIPSLDGSLYSYQSSGVLRAIPVNSDGLLTASLRFGADVMAGARTVTAHGINYRSGRLHYSCALKDCQQAGLKPSQIRHSLNVRRTSQTIRAVDPSSGWEKWNVSVGELDLHLPASPTDSLRSDASFCQSQARNQHEAQYWARMQKVRFVVDPGSGYVAGVWRGEDGSEEVLWEARLDSPVSQAWEIREDALSPLSLFDPSVVASMGAKDVALSEALEEDSLYMGTFQSSRYLIPSPGERRKLRLAALNRELTRQAPTADHRRQLPMLEGSEAAGKGSGNSNELALLEPELVYAPTPPGSFRVPPRGSDQCRFKVCPTCSTEEAKALIAAASSDVAVPDRGWFLFKHRAMEVPSRTRRWLLSDTRRRGSIQEALTSSVANFILAFWRSLLVSLASVLLTIAGMRYCYRREPPSLQPVHPRSPSISQADTSSGTPMDVVKESGGTFPTANSQLSKDSGDSILAGPSSRFLEDYEPLGVLGHGGFGVVYSARNKVDAHEYAVKRVRVPNATRGRRAVERVSREVGVLASLNHPAIVRYYAAWFESYPADLAQSIQRRISEACGEAEAEDAEEESHSRLGGEANNSFAAISGEEVSSLRADLLNANLRLSLNAAEWQRTKGEEESRLAEEPSSSWADFSVVAESERSGDISTSTSSVRHPSPAAANADAANSRSLEVVFAAPSGASPPLNPSAGSERSAAPPVPAAPERLYLFMTMQLCQESTLALWLRQNLTQESRRPTAMLDWFAQIVSAVEYIHDNHLIHRDLKPSNIFFDEAEHLKVGDFGLATAIAEAVEGSDPSVAASGEPSEEHTADVGTRLYMAPEQRAGTSYTASVDVWALGLILLEMLCPFGTEMERRTALTAARGGEFPPSFRGEEEEELVRWMLSPVSDKRPTCAELRDSKPLKPFFQSADWVRSLSAANPAALRTRAKTSSSADAPD